MTKTCSTCRETLPIDSFARNKSRLDGRKAECKPCGNAASREWRKNNPSYQRNWRETNRDKQRVYNRKHRLKREYGLTEAEYEAMFLAQAGVCAICQQASSETLAVDHNHKTGAVRALLCSKCNTALGLLGEDADRLMAAATYLLQHEDVLRMEEAL